MHARYFEATELQEVAEPNEESTPEFEGEGNGCLPFIGFLIVIIFLL